MQTTITLDQFSRLLDEKLEEIFDRKLEEKLEPLLEKKFEEKLAPIHKLLEKHDKQLNQHTRQLRALKKGQDAIIKFFDRQSIKSERRLDRIEDYLRLPPLPPTRYALREK